MDPNDPITPQGGRRHSFGGAIDKACTVFSANMRRASLSAICEPSKIAAFNESPDFGDETPGGESGLAVGPCPFSGPSEGLRNGTTAAGEGLEDLERLAMPIISAHPSSWYQ
jgi:hypothetical protein